MDTFTNPPVYWAIELSMDTLSEEPKFSVTQIGAFSTKYLKSKYNIAYYKKKENKSRKKKIIYF